MLTSVFNKCLEKGIFRNTQASVAVSSSFRPLGMINSTGKLFERFILTRMENVCEEEDNEGIPTAQFGFRKRLTTHHALKKVEKSLGGSSRTTEPGRILRHNSARHEECV